MVRKRGQMTLFLILGIIILLAVGLWMFMNNSDSVDSDGRSLGTESEATGKKDSERKVLQQYIQSCFEDTTDDALLLFGKQGGYIYKSQGGIDPDFSETNEGEFFVFYDSCNGHECMVPYWMKRPRSGACADPYQSCPYDRFDEKYPWIRFPFKDKNGDSFINPEFETDPSSPVFGRVLAPPLHESQGAGSIEGKLKSYIINNIDECLGPSFGDFGDIYDVIPGEVAPGMRSNASVLLTKNDFRVTLYYPVTFEKDGNTYSFNSFNYKIGVRLKRIYDALVKVMEMDSRNATFDIVMDGERYANLADGAFENQATGDFYLGGDAHIRVYRGSERYDEDEAEFVSQQAFYHDDIIEIVDDQSKIKKEEYVWRFVRQNRAPALYYVHDTFGGNGVDQNQDIEIAHQFPDMQFEEIWLDANYDDGSDSLKGLDWLETLSFNPRNGSLLEYHEYLITLDDPNYVVDDVEFGIADDQVERAFVYVPFEKYRINDNLQGYLDLRGEWHKELEKPNPDASKFLFVHQLQAVDPDEESVDYSVQGKDPTFFLHDRGYQLRKNPSCIDGSIVLRVSVTDEAGLEDMQDVRFMVDPRLDLFNQPCGCDAGVCGHGNVGEVQAVAPEQLEAIDEDDFVDDQIDPNKPMLHVISVAMNYNGHEGQTGGHANILFNARANTFFSGMQNKFSGYNVFHRKITDPTNKECKQADELEAWVDGLAQADILPDLKDYVEDADELVILGFDNMGTGDWQGPCGCNRKDDDVFYITEDNCAPGGQTAQEYFDNMNGLILKNS